MHEEAEGVTEMNSVMKSHGAQGPEVGRISPEGGGDQVANVCDTLGVDLHGGEVDGDLVFRG